MYDHKIKGMVEALVADGVIDEEVRQSATESLEKYWENTAGLIWTVDDVMSLAEDKEIKITKEQAIEVIESVGNNEDASEGISWDTIEWHLDDVLDLNK